MTQVIRRVLIRERELKKLKHKALVKSDYGHKKLYDTCEWRPITEKDLLMVMLKNEKVDLSWIKSWVGNQSESMYDKRYYYWEFRMINGVLMGDPCQGNSSWEPFGWAVLTKNKG